MWKAASRWCLVSSYSHRPHVSHDDLPLGFWSHPPTHMFQVIGTRAWPLLYVKPAAPTPWLLLPQCSDTHVLTAGYVHALIATSNNCHLNKRMSCGHFYGPHERLNYVSDRRFMWLELKHGNLFFWQYLFKCLQSVHFVSNLCNKVFWTYMVPQNLLLYWTDGNEFMW